MDAERKFRRAGSLAALSLAACDGPQRVFDTAGPGAAQIEVLWWIMFGLAAVISIVTIALLLLAVRRGRQRRDGQGEPGRVHEYGLVWIGGVIVPVVVLFALLVYSYRLGYPVLRAFGPQDRTVEIRVTGHQFWWEVRYPAHDIETANQIIIPAGRPVRLVVTSPDVIHSIWIPQLQGKIDMTPGRITNLWLRADRPGDYRGVCTEFCGLGHALMAFWVHALPSDDFDRWVDERRAAAALPDPDDAQVARGRAVFAEANCAACHGTRGAPLPQTLRAPGPDLTDFATRQMIAAATLPNTRENLLAWLSNPDAVKPGSRMPPTVLPPADMEALLAYLGSLR